MKSSDFTFTDNRPIHQHVVTLDASQLAAHLAKDPQFMFYWRRGWDGRLAATRSLYTNPPSTKATVSPSISDEQWQLVNAALNELSLR
jgi:hypothetical protein